MIEQYLPHAHEPPYSASVAEKENKQDKIKINRQIKNKNFQPPQVYFSESWTSVLQNATSCDPFMLCSYGNIL